MIAKEQEAWISDGFVIYLYFSGSLQSMIHIAFAITSFKYCLKLHFFILPTLQNGCLQTVKIRKDKANHL